MKATIKLEGEEEIRAVLEEALMLESLENYVGRMAEFYWHKARDLVGAMGDGDAQAKVRDKYGDILQDQPSDKYLVLSALDDYESANILCDTFQPRVNQMVMDLTDNPVSVECADDEDPDEVADAWLDIDKKVWKRFTGDIAWNIGDLCRHSAGFTSDGEYDDMLNLHLGKDRQRRGRMR